MSSRLTLLLALALSACADDLQTNDDGDGASLLAAETQTKPMPSARRLSTRE